MIKQITLKSFKEYLNKKGFAKDTYTDSTILEAIDNASKITDKPTNKDVLNFCHVCFNSSFTYNYNQ